MSLHYLVRPVSLRGLHGLSRMRFSIRSASHRKYSLKYGSGCFSRILRITDLYFFRNAKNETYNEGEEKGDIGDERDTIVVRKDIRLSRLFGCNVD